MEDSSEVQEKECTYETVPNGLIPDLLLEKQMPHKSRLWGIVSY